MEEAIIALKMFLVLVIVAFACYAGYRIAYDQYEVSVLKLTARVAQIERDINEVKLDSGMALE